MFGGKKVESYFAYAGLLGIFLTIICTAISWWALQTFRFDLFTTNPKGIQAKALQIILALIMGYLLTLFFIDYLGWSFNLKNFL